MSKKLLLLVLLVLCGALAAHATQISDNFTISCTPSGDRGVIITTTSVNLGNIAAGGEDETMAIPVLTTGTVANIDYTIQGTDPGGGVTLSTNETPTADEILLYALFNTVQGGTMGSDDVVTTSPQQVGDGSGVNFEGDVEMDGMGLLVERNLFCKIKLPATVNYTAQQTMTVTIAAEANE